MSDYRRLEACLCGLALLCLVLPVHGEAPLSDPMRPPLRVVGGQAAAPPKPVLSYTRVSGDQRHALIDDRLVGEGDSVAGARVERIERGKVHLRRGAALQVLTLSARPKAIPQPVPDKDSENEQ